MTIGTLKSPNPGEIGTAVLDKYEIFIRFFDEHFARHFQSHCPET